MESKTFNLTPDTLSMIREYLAEGVARTLVQAAIEEVNAST